MLFRNWWKLMKTRRWLKHFGMVCFAECSVVKWSTKALRKLTEMCKTIALLEIMFRTPQCFWPCAYTQTLYLHCSKWSDWQTQCAHLEVSASSLFTWDVGGLVSVSPGRPKVMANRASHSSFLRGKKEKEEERPWSFYSPCVVLSRDNTNCFVLVIMVKYDTELIFPLVFYCFGYYHQENGLSVNLSLSEESGGALLHFLKCRKRVEQS